MAALESQHQYGTPRILVEVCIDSVESTLAAVRGGADRLELCGNLGVGGGTTPSVGLFKRVKKAAPNTPIMVMIRPRTGDFLYSPAELDVMIDDIQVFKELGAEGVVFGVLQADGQIDVERTRRLALEADGMQICFHRAFDMTPTPDRENDAEAPLNQLVQIPSITRVLTSGRATSAPTAIHPLRTLMWVAQVLSTQHRPSTSPLVVMPGSGINPAVIVQFVYDLLLLGLREIHLSGGSWIDGGMQYRKDGMRMGVGGGEWGVWRTSEEVVREVRKAVDAAWEKYQI